MNRLADSTSPYLLAHADQPVDWWPWGEAAFAEARRRGVPVLLSVGYAACHWCHVMARESFTDPVLAAVINERYVPVKVDREQRPDVDATYMAATIAMTGQGGWPMTVFLTPDGEPFSAGTYFPNAPAGTMESGLPAFIDVLEGISAAWRSNPDEVTGTARTVGDALGAAAGTLPTGQPASAADVETAVTAVLSVADPEHGGFRGAPKFPAPQLLEALLRFTERTGSSAAAQFVTTTARAMADGGINDRIAGGFCRYTVDDAWRTPHFEKMLYDNAQLLGVYAHLVRRGDARAPEVVRSTVGFLLRELRDGSGAFIASLDADTDGVEGASYVWTRTQLDAVLGPEDGPWAAELLQIGERGPFGDGDASVPQWTGIDPSDPAFDAGRWERVRAALAQARAGRPQPAREEKVLASWNGLAIAALVDASVALGEPAWLDSAREAADAVWAAHVTEAPFALVRDTLGGRAGAQAMLDDYALLASALLALFQVTGEQRFLARARLLMDAAIAEFAEPEQPGAWFDAPARRDGLPVRKRDPRDEATPSGASAMAGALLTAALLTEDAGYRRLADATAACGAVVLRAAPEAAGTWLAQAEAVLRGPLQIAVAADETDPLVTAARRLAPGGAVVVAGQRDSQPLLADRGPVRGSAAAYVCRGFVCDLPVTDPADLAEALAPVTGD